MPVIREDIIQNIEEEICSYGALRLALKEFRKLTGESAVNSLALLRAYLAPLSHEALLTIAQKLGCRLQEVAYPRITA